MGQTYKNFGSLLSCYFVRALILKRARPFIRDISAWIISKKLFWHFVLFMYMSTSSFHSNQSPILYRRFRKIIIMAWYWNKPIYLILDLIGTSQHISKFVARGIRTGGWGGGGGEWKLVNGNGEVEGTLLSVSLLFFFVKKRGTQTGPSSPAPPSLSPLRFCLYWENSYK